MRMKIGIGIGDIGGAPATSNGIVAQAKRAEADGFASGWFANIFGFDAIMLAALCARETTRIELGTAVVPTFPRHPTAMAQQALTAQAMARRPLHARHRALAPGRHRDDARPLVREAVSAT